MNINLSHLSIKVFFLFFIAIVYSQGDGSKTMDLKVYVPSEPNVAALSKYGLIPISEYTGVPNISIPLHTISEDNVSVPISLSYHSGGIRVSEEASNVGLGWSLLAGGMITRNMEDRDDLGNYGRGMIPDPILDINGFFDSNFNSIIGSNLNCEFLYQGNLTYFEKSNSNNVSGRKDLIPDTFHYNFNGNIGSFVLTADKKVHFSEKTDLKINLLTDNTFEAITADGSKYFFSRKTMVNLLTSSPNFIPYISSWYLTQIITNQNEVIDFIYESRENYKPLSNFSQVYLSSGNINSYFIPTVFPISQFVFETTYLTEIKSSNTKINFIYSNSGERLDITTGYSLNSIQINSINNLEENEIKRYDFNYSYFGSTNGNTLRPLWQGDYSYEVNALNSDSNLTARLKLDSITENNTKTHSFFYNYPAGSYFPRKTSMSQDHWGLFNGVININSFIPDPNVQVYDNDANDDFGIISPEFNAKRYASETFAKTFTLNKIVYPTEGYTTFDHELHSYDNQGHDVAVAPQTKTIKSSSTEGAGIITDTFTLSSNFPTTRVDLEYRFIIYNWPGQPNYPPILQSNAYIEISDSDGNVIDRSRYELTQENAVIPGSQAGLAPITGALDKTIRLLDGTYTIKVHFTDDLNIQGESRAKISWQSEYVNLEKLYGLGGGLRVKSITDHDTNGTIISKRNYDYHYKTVENNTEVEKSYGRLRNRPNYTKMHTISGVDSRYPYFHYGVDAGGRGYSIYYKSTSSLYQDFGSYVGYDQITVRYTNNENKDNGKEVFKFHNENNRYRPKTYGYAENFAQQSYNFPRIKDPDNGLLYLKEDYKKQQDNTYVLVSKLENDYAINGIPIDNYNHESIYQNPDYILGAHKITRHAGLTIHNGDLIVTPECHENVYSIQLHPYYSNLIQHTSTKKTIYDLNGQNPVVTHVKYGYNSFNPTLISETETTNSNGEIIKTKNYFPDDIDSVTYLDNSNLSLDEFNAIKRLQTPSDNNPGALHQIAIPIQIKTTVSGNSGVVLSKSTQRTNFKIENDLVLPKNVQTSNENDLLEDRIIYHLYDDNGNPLEISKKNGIKILHIWGYNKKYPIAKIENATYSQVQSFVPNLETLSNLDNDRTLGYSGDEGALRQALDNLRNAPSLLNAMITTYTYDTLIGVTSITDPKGYTIYYEYDELNRLKQVKDQDGKILSENDYHYINQN